jgi:hypothetical protein
VVLGSVNDHTIHWEQVKKVETIKRKILQINGKHNYYIDCKKAQETSLDGCLHKCVHVPLAYMYRDSG